jgi:hypothetical protein
MHTIDQKLMLVITTNKSCTTVQIDQNTMVSLYNLPVEREITHLIMQYHTHMPQANMTPLSQGGLNERHSYSALLGTHQYPPLR